MLFEKPCFSAANKTLLALLPDLPVLSVDVVSCRQITTPRRFGASWAAASGEHAYVWGRPADGLAKRISQLALAANKTLRALFDLAVRFALSAAARLAMAASLSVVSDSKRLACEMRQVCAKTGRGGACFCALAAINDMAPRRCSGVWGPCFANPGVARPEGFTRSG